MSVEFHTVNLLRLRSCVTWYSMRSILTVTYFATRLREAEVWCNTLLSASDRSHTPNVFLSFHVDGFSGRASKSLKN